MTERQQNNAFKPQRDDIDLASDVNELDTNVAEKSAPEYVGDENTNARKEPNSDDAFDERERAVINKFSGVRWIRKNKNTTPSDGVAAQNAADINKSAMPEKHKSKLKIYHVKRNLNQKRRQLKQIYTLKQRSRK